MSFGSGGGGGSSGAVSNETYWSQWHENVLGDSATAGGSGIWTNLVLVMNAYWQDNPYIGEVAHSPDTYITDVGLVTNTVYNLASVLNPVTDWQSYTGYVIAKLDADVLGTTALEASEAAFNDTVDAEYENVTLPRFQRGMQDANAVMSSAYVIGKALLEEEVVRRKAVYSADLRQQNYKTRIDAILSATDMLIKLAGVEHEFLRTTVATYVDARRITYVAKKEETDRNLEIAASEAKWDIDAFMLAGNFLAAAHGGTSVGSTTKPSMGQSVLGGAMSGASLGTSVYPGWGTVIGAIGGAAFGLGQQLSD